MMSKNLLASEVQGRIAIVTNGTTEDVLPHLYIAEWLVKKHKHKVRLFTNVNFVQACQERSLEVVSCYADSEEVTRSIGGLRGTLAEESRKAQRVIDEWVKVNPTLIQAPKAALEEFKPDLIICGTQASSPTIAYETLHGTPVVPIFLSQFAMDTWEWMTKLEPLRPAYLAMSKVYKPALPSNNVIITGPCLSNAGLEKVEAEKPRVENAKSGILPAELEQFFFFSDSPPVLLTWGTRISADLGPVGMLGLALRTLLESGRRGIILGGWAELDVLGNELVNTGHVEGLGDDCEELADYAAMNVCFVKDADLDTLCRKCACVIHDGAPLVTQLVLRAGVPSVITPIFYDQYVFADAQATLKAGVGFKQGLVKLTSKDLVQGIADAERCLPAARELAARMSEHASGEEETAKRLNEFMQKEVLSGSFRRRRAEMKQGRRRATRG